MIGSNIIYKSQAIEGGVSIAGNFNTWKPEKMQYKLSEQYYEYFLKANEPEKTKIYFKFIENKNGKWFTDDNYSVEYDDIGNDNNVIILKEDGDMYSNTPVDAPVDQLSSSIVDSTKSGDSPTSTPKNLHNTDGDTEVESEIDSDAASETTPLFDNTSKKDSLDEGDECSATDNILNNKDKNNTELEKSLWTRFFQMLKNFLISLVNWIKN